MDARRWAVLVLAGALACGRGAPGTDSNLMKEGRTYTAWLYGSEYRKLWDRFSPEMQQTFGSVADLANFASHAVKNLGVEQGSVSEKVQNTEPFRVYTRAASFKKSRHPMLIEWSLARDGEVTGLVVRPAPTDSTMP